MSKNYKAPGLLPGANAAVLSAWNAWIEKETTDLLSNPNLSRAADHLVAPSEITTAPVSLQWGGDPAEPRFCLDEEWARKLSDWGVRGRHTFHNEYCEYTIVTKVDSTGRVRLKRFTATTELSEWWITVATEDPAYLLQMARDIAGSTVGYKDLYGADVVDPTALTASDRRVRFATQVAGNGYHQDLIDAGVPAQPVGSLNTEHALFMSHPINGLDDLIYIVIFGAQPYVVQNAGGGWRKAALHEIFVAQGTTHLQCRNADPTAAVGAFDHVLKSVKSDLSSARGSKIAFADPIGMYFQSFQSNKLFYKGAVAPTSWTVFSRGSNDDLKQRLEFGPPDSEDAYLDEVMIVEGASSTAVTGGYQLAKLLEVGPRLLVGQEVDLTPRWFKIPAANKPDCSLADVCTSTVGPAKAAYEQQNTPPGLRGA